MWSISEINNKRKEVIKRLKTCKNPDEKEKLELSLASYISLLDNSGTIRYTKFYNLMDRITKGNFTLLRPSSKLIAKGNNILLEKKDYMDESYLEFLLQLATNVSNSNVNVEDNEDVALDKMEFPNEKLIEISKLFYAGLGDEEIFKHAKRILDDPSAINFSDIYVSAYENAGGITFPDFVYDKAYCTTKRGKTLFDVQANNHEVMHGIDFYMKQKIPSKNYYGFHETPTYTIDYLFIEYLEELGINKAQVQKLRLRKDEYLVSLANLVTIQIPNELIRKKGLMYIKRHTTKDIMEILNPDIVKKLLEIESGVIAFGIYQQIKENRQAGLNNLKKFMKNLINKDRRPNFESIGLSDEKILELSKMIGTYSREHEKERGRIR